MSISEALSKRSQQPGFCKEIFKPKCCLWYHPKPFNLMASIRSSLSEGARTSEVVPSYVDLVFVARALSLSGSGIMPRISPKILSGATKPVRSVNLQAKDGILSGISITPIRELFEGSQSARSRQSFYARLARTSIPAIDARWRTLSELRWLKSSV